MKQYGVTEIRQTVTVEFHAMYTYTDNQREAYMGYI